MSSSSKNIIKNNKNLEVKSYFDEDVFYPRLNNKEKEIREAKKKALGILQDAESQAATVLEKFKQEGLRQGLGEVNLLIAGLSSAMKELKQFKEKAIKELESTVVDLAFHISKKIVKSEVKTNPKIVKNVAKAVLASLIDKENIVLQVNPQDKKLMEKYQNEIMKFFQDIRNLEIEANEAVSRGGCYLKSERGDVDATLETQFSEIEKSLGRK